MGGTFDPVHYGHLVTAEEAFWQFALDEVMFVPTGEPWMKGAREVTPAEDRYLMTVIATSSNPHFSVSRVEIDRPGPTYTVDTLRTIQEQRGPGVDLYFITGADAILEIFHWKDPEEVLSLAHVIAATRPGYEIARFEAEAPTRHPNVSVMTIPALAISPAVLLDRLLERQPETGAPPIVGGQHIEAARDEVLDLGVEPVLAVARGAAVDHYDGPGVAARRAVEPPLHLQTVHRPPGEVLRRD